MYIAHFTADDMRGSKDKSCDVQVTAGTASHLQPSSSLPDRLSITNGQAAEERKLLPGVTWQLQDAFGNGVHLSGIPVKLALEAGGRSFDGQLPSLQVRLSDA